MRLITITVCVLFSLISVAKAEINNAWVELGFGGTGDYLNLSANIKLGDQDSNWALELSGYEGEVYLINYADRINGENLNVEVKTLGVTKNWTLMGHWWYLDAGLGLGVAKGTWVSNCIDDPDGGFFYFTEICDSANGYRPGIPVHATFALGRYAGIGLTLKAFITNEDAHAGFVITMPFGNFTK